MKNVKNLQSDRQTNDGQQAICKVHLAFSSGELKRGILQVRGSFKTYVDFYHNFFSRRHITLRFGTHILTTNSVDLKEKFLNLT